MIGNVARLRSLGLLVVAIALSGCGMNDDAPLGHEYGPEIETRRAELNSFCEVRVDGVGTLSVEEEYLAQVVTCEHAGAPMETLKAQAIAARGYAKYVVDVENRPLSPTVRDQAYNCGRPATDRARKAVRETSGMVLTHQGKLIMPFYVAGSTNVSSSTCRASGSSGTQQYVTYNQGRIGGQVQGSSLGWVGNPANRGAMSQNGSACLANKGWKAERILRFFYGDDIRVTKLPGACVLSDTDPNLGSGTIDSDSGSSNTCDDAGAAPDIITRSEWGARAPRGNWPRHNPNRFTIHHTVGPNNDTSPRSTIRGIQNYHMDSRGWADIGYHYLVDQQGRIYGGVPVERRGAHVGGQNTGNIGISFMGNYQTLRPTGAQLKSAGKLIRHLSDKYGISPSATTVKGHRDQGATACPGNHLYAKIGAIIQNAHDAADSGQCDNPPSSSDQLPQYKYVRVRAVGETPYGDSDSIDGFELDSVYGVKTAGGDTLLAQSARATGSVTNAGAVTGRPDNNSCDNRASTVAGIGVGGAVIAELAEPLEPGDKVGVVQANYNVGLSGCAPSGTAEIAVSADGTNWTVLSSSVSGNATVTIDTSDIKFTKPAAGSRQGRRIDFAVDASDDIVRVEYLADDWSLGSSRQGPDFSHHYDFQYTGVRELEARGYDASGNLVAIDTISVTVKDASSLSFTKPAAGSRQGRRIDFAVDASDDITRVEYLADDWSLGSSRQGPDFSHHYDFQYTGVRKLEARGYDASGNLVASDTISVTVKDASSLDITRPVDGSINERDVTFQARASSDIVQVEYSADNWTMGGSTSKPRFSFNYDFDYTGVRKIEARGYDASGNMVAVDRVEITVKDASHLNFVAPVNGSTQNRLINFGVDASDDVVEVEYFADDWSLGSSTSKPRFAHSYDFQYTGVRRLEARGYNARGDIVAVDRISVTVKDSGAVSSQMALKLGQEGGTCSEIGNGQGGPRCTNGRGGWSTGQCWGYVKAAMIRAGLATRADINQLAARVGMSAYSVQISAAGFKRAADRASISDLRQTMGLRKVNTPVGRAPRGAVIAWAPGCRGAHSVYGHIEIAQGDGYACSDYCGRLRADASCASVYVPVD